MDSNDQEKERGITILSKNTAINWKGNRINIVDTPGHADFGGEVERVLSMVDSVLILVDAMDGPMPQTRFVTQKAFAMGFKPIVVVNKIDRPGARPDWVIDQVFDLFDKLGATNEQLDFPIVYASALHGYASLDDSAREGDMTPLYEAIMKHVPPPDVDPDGPFQMRISQLDYNNFVGLIGVGRIQRGKVRTNMPVSVVDRHGKKRQGKVLQVLGFLGLERIEVEEAEAGDIVAISGVADLSISDTICALDTPGSAAGADRGRADDQHDLPGQQLAVRRQQGTQRRQVHHQPPDPRAPGARNPAQRGAEGRGRFRPGQVPGLRPRRTAPVGADREHAPRRLRAGRVAPGSDHQGNRRPADGADRAAGGRHRRAAPGRRDGKARHRARPS